MLVSLTFWSLHNLGPEEKPFINVHSESGTAERLTHNCVAVATGYSSSTERIVLERDEK